MLSSIHYITPHVTTPHHTSPHHITRHHTTPHHTTYHNTSPHQLFPVFPCPLDSEAINSHSQHVAIKGPLNPDVIGLILRPALSEYSNIFCSCFLFTAFVCIVNFKYVGKCYQSATILCHIMWKNNIFSDSVHYGLLRILLTLYCFILYY